MAVNAVALSPHNDDVELFAAAQLFLFEPHVVVVFRSRVQELRGTGIGSRQREAETAAAMAVFGLSWEQWPYLDSEAAPPDCEAQIVALAEHFDLCIAPAVEEGGHEQHNQVGRMALAAFGDNVIPYLTYKRGHGRSVGRPVALTAACRAKKAAALACYESQIAEPSTAAWFRDGIATEWLA